MKSIVNFLMFVNNNFVSILVCIGLIIGITSKIRNFLLKSNEEKVAIAKHQIREVMLKMISDAECDYDEWDKAGEIKRSQVIKKIYEMYPILSKVVNQEELTAWIDEEIDSALFTLNEIIDGIEE